MRRQDLAHILRAACDVTQDPEIVVLGSQAILGSYDEDDLPPLATASMEADLAWPADGPDRERADLVNGRIGELSMFDANHGYYPEGISIETAVLPEGWQTRLTSWDLQSSAPARPRFLDKHDLAVAKLAAHRPKDLAFVGALLEHRLLDADTLRERAEQLPADVDPRTRASAAAAVESLTRSRKPGQARAAQATDEGETGRERFRAEHSALQDRLDHPRPSGSTNDEIKNATGGPASSADHRSAEEPRRRPGRGPSLH